MAKFHLESNLSEKQIEADVSNYMGWITEFDYSPYRLLDTSEKLTGADKKLESFLTFFIQFKKSNGLIPIINNTIYSSLNNSPINRIRKFRKYHDLEGNPILYFKIHKLSPTSIDFQHNLLLKLNSTPCSYAFYIAPLLLDKDVYFRVLFDSYNRFLIFPFNFELDKKIYSRNWVTHFGRVPVLRAHVSVPPSEHVRSSEHYYSYSQHGTDIAWHSGKVISQKINRLSEKLAEIYKISPKDEAFWINYKIYIDRYYFLLNDLGITNDSKNIESSDIIFYVGKRLYEKFQIKQFLLIKKD